MDMKDIKADMILNNLYFKDIKFSRQSKIEDGEYSVEISRTVQHLDKDFIVTMPIKITKKDMDLTITTVGSFDFTSNIEDANVKENMIKNNAAAIMFPFIRSQVSLISTQPGMAPIILPAINVTKMMD